MIFRVYADNELLGESPLVSHFDYWHFDLPLPEGAKEVRLVVDETADGPLNDHGDWVQAGFLLK